MAVTAAAKVHKIQNAQSKTLTKLLKPSTSTLFAIVFFIAQRYGYVVPGFIANSHGTIVTRSIVRMRKQEES